MELNKWYSKNYRDHNVNLKDYFYFIKAYGNYYEAYVIEESFRETGDNLCLCFSKRRVLEEETYDLSLSESPKNEIKKLIGNWPWN